MFPRTKMRQLLETSFSRRSTRSLPQDPVRDFHTQDLLWNLLPRVLWISTNRSLMAIVLPTWCLSRAFVIVVLLEAITVVGVDDSGLQVDSWPKSVVGLLHGCCSDSS